MSGDRLDFELDHEIGVGAVTAHGGVPALIEHFRSSGAAAIVDGEVVYKKRKRGLSASEMAESLLALWACGGEPAEDLDRLRDSDGLPLLLGHGLPASQTARDYLAVFNDPALPLLGGAGSLVRSESQGLRALARASGAVVAGTVFSGPHGAPHETNRSQPGNHIWFGRLKRLLGLFRITDSSDSQCLRTDT